MEVEVNNKNIREHLDEIRKEMNLFPDDDMTWTVMVETYLMFVAFL